jgi:hypothetical protein
VDRRPKGENGAAQGMAAPEAPLCYVGVAKKSAAFRLMKQMVRPLSSFPLIFLFENLDWTV